MKIENLTREDLRILIENIVRNVFEEKKTTKRNISSKHYSHQSNLNSSNNEMENLIGSVPFILLDKKIFEKNADVIRFAATMGIDVLHGEKRKIDEIVGRIIVAIKEFPPSRVAQLNKAIAELKVKTSLPHKKNKISFLEEWDKVIKNMKL